MKKLSIGLIMFFILYKNDASNFPGGMGPHYSEPTGGPHMSPPHGPIPLFGNQSQPQVVIVEHLPNFGTEPVSLICQFCKNPVTTTVKKQISPCALSSCILSLCIFYAIVQACRDKEINCWNAVHTCPSCGQQLGTYTAI